MAIADQATQFDILLDSIATVCQFGTGLSDRKIVEWYDDSRSNVEGQQVVTIRFGSWLPEDYAGAGREGMLTDLEIIVTLWTQMKGPDKASTDKWRFRNSAVGHLPRMMGILDWLDGEVLYSAYNNATQSPTGNPLSWEPLQHLPGPFCTRVSAGDETWIKSELRFRTKIAKPLTVG